MLPMFMLSFLKTISSSKNKIMFVVCLFQFLDPVLDGDTIGPKPNFCPFCSPEAVSLFYEQADSLHNKLGTGLRKGT